MNALLALLVNKNIENQFILAAQHNEKTWIVVITSMYMGCASVYSGVGADCQGRGLGFKPHKDFCSPCTPSQPSYNEIKMLTLISRGVHPMGGMKQKSSSSGDVL